MSVAVVTIVSGRHAHLDNQQQGLCAGDRLPDHYVVVAMNDPEALRRTQAGPLAGRGCAIHPVLIGAGTALPLAAARNAGAAAALAAGAAVVVFLDVDCIPAASLVRRYEQSVRAETGPTLHCGVVRYLDAESSRARPPRLQGDPHPARPVPGSGQTVDSREWSLFWSLSFAISAETWRRLGGFCELYQGYGAEDTDFGYTAHLAGIDLRWVGDADAFHQFHPTENPPVRHLTDILRNATVFHRRWGFWPMAGWLQAFAEAGLASYDIDRDAWSATSPVAGS